jgi:hypothetical protein
MCSGPKRFADGGKEVVMLGAPSFVFFAKGGWTTPFAQPAEGLCLDGLLH